MKGCREGRGDGGERGETKRKKRGFALFSAEKEGYGISCEEGPGNKKNERKSTNGGKRGEGKVDSRPKSEECEQQQIMVMK